MMKPLITPLCGIGAVYKTDKSRLIKHPYTPVYYDLLKDKKNSIKKVLEFGIGHPKTGRHKASGYEAGASLKMWRDFLPNAHIYGVDIAPHAMIKGEERITTFVCDEREPENVKKLIKRIGSDIDFVVDDASHFWRNQVVLAKTLLPLLPKDVIYVIEDIERPVYIQDRLKEYEVIIPELEGKKYKDSMLMVVKNK